MVDLEFKKLMEENGAFVHHFGLLVHDRDKTLDVISQLPGVGEWMLQEDYWGPDNVIVGAVNTLKIGQAKLYDYTMLELVEPVKGKCTGTYFEKYLEENEEGLHHICYAFPDVEDFYHMMEKVKELGYEIVHHATGICAAGTPEEYECEYCYAKPPVGGMIVELNWAGANRKNNISGK